LYQLNLVFQTTVWTNRHTFQAFGAGIVVARFQLIRFVEAELGRFQCGYVTFFVTLAAFDAGVFVDLDSKK
jgi:hypothetical protein